MENILIKFKKKINSVANFNDHNLNKKLFFPYKPALVLSIIIVKNSPELFFNNEIVLDVEVTNKYFDILCSSKTFRNFLKVRKSEWFNKDHKSWKSIISHLKSLPIKALTIHNSNFWVYNSKTNTIRINLPEDIDKIAAYNYLFAFSMKKLNECIFDFEYNFDKYFNNETLNFNIKEFESKLSNNLSKFENNKNDDFEEYLLFLEDF